MRRMRSNAARLVPAAMAALAGSAGADVWTLQKTERPGENGVYVDQRNPVHQWTVTENRAVLRQWRHEPGYRDKKWYESETVVDFGSPPSTLQTGQQFELRASLTHAGRKIYPTAPYGPPAAAYFRYWGFAEPGGVKANFGSDFHLGAAIGQPAASSVVRFTVREVSNSDYLRLQAEVSWGEAPSRIVEWVYRRQAGAPAAPPPAAASGDARVTFVGGTVVIVRAGAPGGAPARVGDPVATGDRIETGADGLVRIEILAASSKTDEVTSGANSRITLVQKADGLTPLIIRIDGVAAWSHDPRSLGPPPTALLGQCMTEFLGTRVFLVGGAGVESVVRVQEGRVRVRGGDGTAAAEVAAGQRLRVDAGGRLGRPVRMEEGEIDSLTARLKRPGARIDAGYGRWVRHEVAAHGFWIDLPGTWTPAGAVPGLAARFQSTDPVDGAAGRGQVYVRVLDADPAVGLRAETDRFLESAQRNRSGIEMRGRGQEPMAGRVAEWIELAMPGATAESRIVMRSWLLRAGGKLYIVTAQADEGDYLGGFQRELKQILSTFRLANPGD